MLIANYFINKTRLPVFDDPMLYFYKTCQPSSHFIRLDKNTKIQKLFFPLPSESEPQSALLS